MRGPKVCRTSLSTSAAALLLLTGCASNQSPPSESPAKPESGGGAPAPTLVAPTLVKPDVVGEPAVLQNPYGLPNEIGYSVAVVLQLRNPSDHALPEARLQASVLDTQGAHMGSTRPTTVALAPNETRTVVLEPDVSVPGDTSNANEIKAKAPVAAEVRTYASTTDPDALVEPSTKWTASDIKVNCNTPTVSCDVTGDLTWTGEGVSGAPRLSVVVRDQGRIVLAGTGDADVESFPPGAAQPFSVSVVGNKNIYGENRPLKAPKVEVTASGQPDPAS